MGCIYTCIAELYSDNKESNTTENLNINSLNIASKSSNHQYSWDLRSGDTMGLNRSVFLIQNISEQEDGRIPGQINGEQMLITKCENCNIFVFDYVNTVTIENCIKCNIYIGAIKGSLNIRDCKDCNLAAACGQFRTRDCDQMVAFLCCASQPIIEASRNMRFGCLQSWYPQLQEHFDAAKLSPYNNLWWKIHDFSEQSHQNSATGGNFDNNWSILGEMYKVYDFIPQPKSKKELTSIQFSTLQEDSFIPLTSGSRCLIRGTDEETGSCSLIITMFLQEKVYQETDKLILKTFRNFSQIHLVKTCQLKLEKYDFDRIFNYHKSWYKTCQGYVTAFHFWGQEEAIERFRTATCEEMGANGENETYQGMLRKQNVLFCSTSSPSKNVTEDVQSIFKVFNTQIGL